MGAERRLRARRRRGVEQALSSAGAGSGKKQGLNGGFGGALALSSASGMTKLEGNRCDVQGWRDGRGGSRGMCGSSRQLDCAAKRMLIKLPSLKRLYCAESDSSVSLTTGATESFVMFRFLQ
jgi:hypothetical protein